MTLEELLKLALISLLIGTIIGIIFLILLAIKRRNTQINSLTNSKELIGSTGIVEIPFNQNSKGKIKVNSQGRIIYLVAVTHLEYEFKPGEKVLIIEFINNKTSVIPENYLNQFNPYSSELNHYETD